MKRYEAHLVSKTPYGQGRYVNVPQERSETRDAYMQRIVRQRMHASNGQVYIPPIALKHCLEETAFYLKLQIPGKGKETYTKHIVQGVLCNEPMMLVDTTKCHPEDEDKPEGERRPKPISPADARIDAHWGSLTPGKANSGRGWIYYPVVDRWEGIAQFITLDERLNEDVMRKHLVLAGDITGLGVWRPRRGGMWGKFIVQKIDVVDLVHEEK